MRNKQLSLVKCFSKSYIKIRYLFTEVDKSGNLKKNMLFI